MKKKELKKQIERIEFRLNNPLYDNSDLLLLFKRVSNLELDKKLTLEAKGDAPEMKLRKQIEALILEFSDANYFLTNTEIVRRLKLTLSTTQEEAFKENLTTDEKVEYDRGKCWWDTNVSGIDFSELKEFTSFVVPKWCHPPGDATTPEEPNYKEMYENLKSDVEHLHNHYGEMRSGEKLKSRIFWGQLGRILSENNLEKDK